MTKTWSDKVLGEPEGTILAVPAVAARPECWRPLLAAAVELEVPVDWLAGVLAHESARPDLEEPISSTIIPAGAMLDPAGVLERVVPYLRGVIGAAGPPRSLGELGMMFWMPRLAHATSEAPADDFIRLLSEEAKARVWEGWKGLVATGIAKGLTVGDVHRWYEAPALAAEGRRIDVERGGIVAGPAHVGGYRTPKRR
jgi:hypothetical protein